MEKDGRSSAMSEGEGLDEEEDDDDEEGGAETEEQSGNESEMNEQEEEVSVACCFKLCLSHVHPKADIPLCSPTGGD